MRTSPLKQCFLIILGFLILAYLLFTLTKEPQAQSISRIPPNTESPTSTQSQTKKAPSANTLTVEISIKTTSSLTSLELNGADQDLIQWKKDEEACPTTTTWTISNPRTAELFILGTWSEPNSALELTLTWMQKGKKQTLKRTFWSEDGTLDDILELSPLLK